MGEFADEKNDLFQYKVHFSSDDLMKVQLLEETEATLDVLKQLLLLLGEARQQEDLGRIL